MERDYIVSQVGAFCRHQAVKAAILSGPDLLKHGKFDELESMMRAAVQVGKNTLDVGVQYFIDWPERLKRRQLESNERIIPTGVTELDYIIGGGLKPKQIGIWMAPTSRGKSIALGHCGKRAVMSRRKVLHYTLELSADEQSSRYDSSFSQIFFKDLIDQEQDLSDKLNKYGLVWGNSLIIKEYPTKQASVSTLRSHVTQCVSFGFEPDLVIVDYLDLLLPPARYKEKRDELTATAEELRGLAIELNVPVWTATQAQRAAISLETLVR
jgi:replicative DNA helicase